MLNKKVTRKQFILSGISILGLLFIGKIPKQLISNQDKNSKTYGSSTYGGK
jgi:hypothetical protein